LVARDGGALASLAEEVPGAVPIPGDLAVDRDVDRIVALVHDRLGTVDLLVNNAGTLGPRRLELVLDTAPADVERAFRVNVLGPLRLTRGLLGPMLLRGAGAVLTVSTDAAVQAYPTWGAYGASKAAFDHLVRTLGAELADAGVAFFTVDPGEMDTEMHRDAVPDADPTTLADPAAVARWIVERLPTLRAGARVSFGEG
jgi:NAD(P)-dependent dehydrogenase (short-subunit alcohol dehydrogenase family)